MVSLKKNVDLRSPPNNPKHLESKAQSHLTDMLRTGFSSNMNECRREMKWK